MSAMHRRVQDAQVTSLCDCLATPWVVHTAPENLTVLIALLRGAMDHGNLAFGAGWNAVLTSG